MPSPSKLVVEDRALYREIWPQYRLPVVSPSEIPGGDFDYYLVSMTSPRKFDVVRELCSRGKVIFLQNRLDAYEMLQLHKAGAYHVLPMDKYKLKTLMQKIDAGLIEDQHTWSPAQWHNAYGKHNKLSNHKVYVTKNIRLTEQLYKFAKLMAFDTDKHECKALIGLSERRYFKSLAILKDEFGVDNKRNLADKLYMLGII